MKESTAKKLAIRFKYGSILWLPPKYAEISYSRDYNYVIVKSKKTGKQFTLRVGEYEYGGFYASNVSNDKQTIAWLQRKP